MLGDGKNISCYKASALINHTGVPFSLFRLRATWLLALLNSDTSLRTVMYLAGLRSPKAILDLLPFLPDRFEIDQDEVASLPLVEVN